MDDSSSVDVNIITNAVDSTGATVITIVQSNNIESSTVDSVVVAGGVGPGVPVGGTSGQVLEKASGTDYDTS